MQSWGDKQIQVNDPLGAKSGKVSDSVNGIKNNEKDFIVGGSNTNPQ
jgi:hypothetical protein